MSVGFERARGAFAYLSACSFFGRFDCFNSFLC